MNVRSLRNLEITFYAFFFFKAVDLLIDRNEPIDFEDMRAKFFAFIDRNTCSLFQLCTLQSKKHKVIAGNSILRLSLDY